MKKQLAQSLRDEAEHTAEIFSDPERAYNNGETFEVHTIKPLSDMTAVVYFKKSSGKFALGLYIYINGGLGKWWGFFPTDSHLLGLQELSKHKLNVESKNFKQNFKEVKQ